MSYRTERPRKGILDGEIPPNSPDAQFCVSTSRYFRTRVEAEAEFERAKDAWPGVTIEFWEKDLKGQWKDTDWFGIDEE